MRHALALYISLFSINAFAACDLEALKKDCSVDAVEYMEMPRGIRTKNNLYECNNENVSKTYHFGPEEVLTAKKFNEFCKGL